MGSWKENIIKPAKRLYLKFYTNPRIARTITNQFHRLYYYTPSPTRTWHKTYWLGLPMYKCPLDLWIYQEIIHELKPDVIIESGTGSGGSALFFASICDLVGKGKVITIDIEENAERRKHARIKYVIGSSTSDKTLAVVRDSIGADDRVLVVLDSDHSMPHVLAELRCYSKLVTDGSYLIVEDTNINGHPVSPQFGPGPMEAVEAFLSEDDRFVVDREREKFFLSFNPHGYLKKVKRHREGPR